MKKELTAMAKVAESFEAEGNFQAGRIINEAMKAIVCKAETKVSYKDPKEEHGNDPDNVADYNTKMNEEEAPDEGVEKRQEKFRNLFKRRKKAQSDSGLYQGEYEEDDEVTDSRPWVAKDIRWREQAENPTYATEDDLGGQVSSDMIRDLRLVGVSVSPDVDEDLLQELWFAMEERIDEAKFSDSAMEQRRERQYNAVRDFGDY